jgi:hypothetical protein
MPSVQTTVLPKKEGYGDGDEEKKKNSNGSSAMEFFVDCNTLYKC